MEPHHLLQQEEVKSEQIPVCVNVCLEVTEQKVGCSVTLSTSQSGEHIQWIHRQHSIVGRFCCAIQSLQ